MENRLGIENKIIYKIIEISLIPILIGGLIVYAISGSFLVPSHPTPIPPGMSLSELIISTIASVVLGVLVVFFMYLLINKRKKIENLVVATIMSPIIFITTVFLGNTLLLILFKGATPNPLFYMVVAFISIYFTLFSFAFILTDTLPYNLRNIFVIAYSSIFGTFLGISLPTITMVVILVVLILEDYLLLSKMPHIDRDDTKYDPYSYIRITLKSIVMGGGDFIVYSIVSSHTMLYFGVFLWLITVFLLIFGIWFSLKYLQKGNLYIPALPVPVGLSLILWVIFFIIT